jgi:hypothetical protein
MYFILYIPIHFSQNGSVGFNRHSMGSMAHKKSSYNPCLSGSTNPLGTVRYSLSVRLAPIGYAWHVTRDVLVRTHEVASSVCTNFYLAFRSYISRVARGGRSNVRVNRDEPADSHWLRPRSYDDVVESPEVHSARWYAGYSRMLTDKDT